MAVSLYSWGLGVWAAWAWEFGLGGREIGTGQIVGNDTIEVIDVSEVPSRVLGAACYGSDIGK